MPPWLKRRKQIDIGWEMHDIHYDWVRQIDAHFIMIEPDRSLHWGHKGNSRQIPQPLTDRWRRSTLRDRHCEGVPGDRLFSRERPVSWFSYPHSDYELIVFFGVVCVFLAWRVRVLHFGTRLLATGNRMVQEAIMDYHDKVTDICIYMIVIYIYTIYIYRTDFL